MKGGTSVSESCRASELFVSKLYMSLIEFDVVLLGRNMGVANGCWVFWLLRSPELQPALILSIWVKDETFY